MEDSGVHLVNLGDKESKWCFDGGSPTFNQHHVSVHVRAFTLLSASRNMPAHQRGCSVVSLSRLTLFVDCSVDTPICRIVAGWLLRYVEPIDRIEVDVSA